MGGGGKGGGGGSSTTTQKVEPWAGQQPYLKGLFNAVGLASDGAWDGGKTVFTPFMGSNLLGGNMGGNMGGAGQVNGNAGAAASAQATAPAWQPTNESSGVREHDLSRMTRGKATGMNMAGQQVGQQVGQQGGQSGNGLDFSGNIFAPDYYPGNTVASQDPFTQQAIQMQARRAMQGSGLNAAAGRELQSTLAGNYLNSPVQGAAMNLINEAGSLPGFLQPYSGGGEAWIDPGGGGGAQAAISQWQGGQNGYLDDMVGRAQNQTLANTAANFSKSGRYGSGAHEAAAHDAAGNVATQMYGQAYEGDQNRDLSAWQAYNQAQLGNAALANQAGMAASDRSLNAWNAAQNRDMQAFGQHQGNMLNAYTNSRNLGLNAMSLLRDGYDRERGNMMASMRFAPSLAGRDYQDIASLSEAGAAREGYLQSLLNADVDRWNYNQAAPLSALQNYGALISGNYGMSGTSTVKGNAGGGGNPLGGVLSGALGGAALGNMTSMGKDWGGLLGGGLGLLSGL